MNLPSRRRLSAIALIIAGIGAFLVPFLLHSPTSQGTSPATTSGNNNNGQGTTRTTTTTSNSHNSGDNSGTSGGSCASDSDPKTPDQQSQATKSQQDSHKANPHDNGNGKDQGNAFGVIKNKMDTAAALIRAMGGADPAFQLHHDTDTDNEATHNASHVAHDPIDQDSSCAEDDNEPEQD